MLGADGQPAVTLDLASVVDLASGSASLWVHASNVTVRRLRFITVKPGSAAIVAQAGGTIHVTLPPAPSSLADVRIEDNVFSNAGVDTTAYAVRVLTVEGMAVGATIDGVTVARNTFTHVRGDGDAVQVGASGTGCTIRDVVVTENTFSESTFPVEIVPHAGSGNSIMGTRIVRNTFTDNGQAISLVVVGSETRPASSNTIDDTVISQNTFSGSQNPDITFNGGGPYASANRIVNTTTTNNLMAGGTPYGGIVIIGGGGTGSSGNRVEGVRIVNNTIVTVGASGVAIASNQDGATGSVVADVGIKNTIISGPGDNFFGEVTPALVSFSLLSHATFNGMVFGGVNGNRTGDPLFVNAAGGGFHLQPGSPGIDAGTSDGAPSKDLECRSRTDAPATPNAGGGTMPFFDIGALEYGGGPPDCSSALTVTKAGSGSGTVASAPAGIDCGAACVAGFASGTQVTLAATPGAGSLFSGWGGKCGGTGTCVITMVSDESVSATFAAARTLAVTRAGTGSGSVTSAPGGIACGMSCSGLFAAGTAVALTATAASGSTFAGWTGGGCSGTGPCTVTLAQNTVVTATFAPVGQVGLAVLRAGSGSGTVTSIPAGIDCGTSCLAVFGSGTAVALMATPAADSVFSGWSGGGCTGTAPCAIAPTQHTVVTATFVLVSVTVSVQARGSGDGSVVSAPAGIDCAATCSASFLPGSAIPFTATAGSGAVFTGWGGACAGTAPTCTVTASVALALTATFSRVFSDGTGAASAVAAGSALIRAAHVTELRSAISTLRSRLALPPFGWTDAALSPATAIVRGVHFAELRTALDQAYQATGQTLPDYADPTLVRGATVIRASHLNELRAAVRALE